MWEEKKILKSLCYKNIPKSGKLAQNLGRFEFHIEQTRSTREELSGKHLCIRMQLEFVQREKLKINGEGKKSWPTLGLFQSYPWTSFLSTVFADSCWGLNALMKICFSK